MFFIVDGMLGSFTRWLRMLGYETEYFREASDEFLLERTAFKDAILLTRDLELLKRAKARGLEAFYVEGNDEAERLSGISARFQIRLDIDEALSRCPKCGSTLRAAETAEVAGQVPVGTLRHFSKFWACSGCGKAYWKGRHWKKINETLARARESLEARVDDIGNP